MNLIATLIFGLAVTHTLVAGRIHRAVTRFPFRLLGEVELVFALWAIVYLIFRTSVEGVATTRSFIGELSFIEPLFVIAVMTVAATRPVIQATRRFIRLCGGVGATLILGPLSGSLITEPAAMTITALILQESAFSKNISSKFKYAILGTLFVNVSIGGTLTPFAAPPVLMVSSKWGWGFSEMFGLFGWKAVIAVVLNAAVLLFSFRSELTALSSGETREEPHVPLGLTLFHFAFLAAIVWESHSPEIFGLIFAAFLIFTRVTRKYQSPSRLGESILVGCFLAGLVVLGHPQRWWIEPLIRQLGVQSLYFGATVLTAITDNAALTYLGALVPTITAAQKYALVAGAVVGGGLTVIANAPNPAGYSILHKNFGEEGIEPLCLFTGALIPTAIALLTFGLFGIFL